MLILIQGNNMKKTNKILSEAVVLFITAFLILSTTAVTAETSEPNFEVKISTISNSGGCRPIGEEIISYFIGDPAGRVGLKDGGTYEAAIRITPEEWRLFEDASLKALNFVYDEAGGHSCALKIYDQGTSSHPGSVIASKSFIADEAGWIRVDLDDMIEIDLTKDYWVSVEVTHLAGEYPIGTDDGPTVSGKGGWVMAGGNWIELSQAGDPPINSNWMFEAIVETSGTTSTELEIIVPSGPMGVNTGIKNAGDNPAANVKYSLKITGGLLGLVNVTVNDTVNELAVGAEEKISSGFFFGLGSIDINVTVSADNANEVSDVKSGFLLGFFVIGIK